MAHRFTVELDPRLVHRAVRSFWLRRFGANFRWVAVVCPALVHGMYQRGSAEVTGWLLAAGTLCLPPFAYYRYWQHLRRSLASLEADRLTVHCILDNTGFQAETARGTREGAWSTLQGLWKCRDYWLLVSRHSGLIILPVAGFADEALRFIETKQRTVAL